MNQVKEGEMSNLTLTRDLPCICCTYNLRGLALDANCPECGHSVIETWEAARAFTHVQFEDVPSQISLDWITAAADAAGIPLDGPRFVLDAITFFPASRRTGPLTENERTRHLSPSDVCAAVREYARCYFNDALEASECLKAWRVSTSEEVGVIIFAMVEAGLLGMSSTDSPQSFNGLFSFDDFVGGLVEQAEPA
jgi:uncharacterized repeat protein (TIGR04138 family)